MRSEDEVTITASMRTHMPLLATSRLEVQQVLTFAPLHIIANVVSTTTASSALVPAVSFELRTFCFTDSAEVVKAKSGFLSSLLL